MSTPITTITLYRTPLSSNGEDVMDSAAHAACLSSSPQMLVTNCTFQRQLMQIRMPISMDVAGRYNYLSYVNNGRVYYGYIANMEYRNDEVTTIQFSLDNWHTYQNDVVYKPTYVERNTVPTSADIPGAYLEPEPVSPSNYFLTEVDTRYFGPFRVLILSTRDGSGTPNTQTQRYNNVYSAARIYNFDDAGAKSFLDGLIESGYESSIAGIYMCPQEFVGTVENPTGGPAPHDPWVLPAEPSSISGYTPRNKKVLTYPYCALHILSSDGEARDYAYEFFGAIPEVITTPQFGVDFAIGSGCEVYIVPTLYANGGSAVSASSLEYAMTIQMPSGSWAGDTGAAWLSVNRINVAMNLLTSSISSAALAFGAGNPMPLVYQAGSAVNTVADFEKNATNAERAAYQMHGIGATPNLFASSGRVGFTAYFKHPTAEEAEHIDDYFSAYGYAINRTMPVSTTNRPTWDFIKTRHAAFSVPDASVDAEIEINAMFDRGIRIWHNASVYGDLSQANA